LLGKVKKYLFFAPFAPDKVHVGTSFHWETFEQVTGKRAEHLDLFVTKNARGRNKLANNFL